MKQQRWIIVCLAAVWLSGCSGDFWGGKNKLEENKLAKFGQKKDLEDARESNDPNSAYEAGQESIFSLGGGNKKGAEAVRADKLFAGAMDVVMGLPIQVANREGGIISTDWKVDPANSALRYRVNIHVTGQEPYGSVRVVVLKQEQVQGNWQDRPADDEAALNISKSIRKQAQFARP